jgi:hypothetical protein
MYTVVRFFGSRLSSDEILALGGELNALQDGLFTGLHPRGGGFGCDVSNAATWPEHARSITKFISRFSEPIAHAIRLGMTVTIDIAIEQEDTLSATALVGLAFPPSLMHVLALAGIVLAVSAYGNAAVDEPGDGAPDERLPDLLPTQADLVPIGALAPAELEEIDRVLLAHATSRRQKMAMVIAQTMRELADRLPKIPFVFYGQRVRRLVRLGQLEGFGDLERMRFSEVRLPRAERG